METGEAAKADLVAAGYDQTRQSYCSLYLLLDRDGLRYLVIDRTNNKIVKAGWSTCDNAVADWYDRALNSAGLKLEYAEVTVALAGVPFTLVPGALFREGEQQGILELTYGREFSSVRTHWLEPWRIGLVCEEPQEMRMAVERYFPSAVFEPFSGWMCERAIREAAGSGMAMLVHVSESFLEIALAGQEGLLLANLYDTRSAEDALYFIGHAATEHKFNRELHPLYYLGEDGTTPELVARYFNRFIPIIPPAGLLLPEEWSSMELDSLRPFYLRELCAS